MEENVITGCSHIHTQLTKLLTVLKNRAR